MDEIKRAILISRLRGAMLSRDLDELGLEFPEIEDLRHKLEIAHNQILKKESLGDSSVCQPSEGEPGAKAGDAPPEPDGSVAKAKGGNPPCVNVGKLRRS
jgi:hypothetical protein